MNLADRLRARSLPLALLSLFGGVGLNGVYLYYAFAHPDVNAAALRNPIAVVFMLESFVLTALGAWVIGRSGLTRPGWRAFVVLSVVGSLAFSVPAFLLWHLRARPAPPPGEPAQ